MPRPREGRPERPVAAGADAATVSLLSEEDLPQWLKVLGAETPEAAPAPVEPSVASPTTTLPAWATMSGTPAGVSAPHAPAADTAPPVWATRPARPKTEPVPSGAMFASLADAVVASETGPAEPELDEQPAPPASQRAPWWWYAVAAGAVALVLVLLLAIMVMR
jgi:hypothetical protein